MHAAFLADGPGRHDRHVGHSLLPYQHLIGSNIPHQGQHKAVMGPQENIELAFAQPGIEKGSHNVLQHSLHSSTRCLSFHVEWQVELRKDKEGLDTVGILLAQHHAHQSAWHHVEAHLSVLYVFWNKGVTCNFFLQRALGAKAAAGLASDALPRWPEGTGAWGKSKAGCNSMAVAARLPIYEDVLEFFHCSPPLQNGLWPVD